MNPPGQGDTVLYASLSSFVISVAGHWVREEGMRLHPLPLLRDGCQKELQWSQRKEDGGGGWDHREQDHQNGGGDHHHHHNLDDNLDHDDGDSGGEGGGLAA